MNLECILKKSKAGTRQRGLLKGGYDQKFLPFVLPFSIPKKYLQTLSSWVLLPQLNQPCQAAPALPSPPLWEAEMPESTALARGKLLQPC